MNVVKIASKKLLSATLFRLMFGKFCQLLPESGKQGSRTLVLDIETDRVVANLGTKTEIG